GGVNLDLFEPYGPLKQRRVPDFLAEVSPIHFELVPKYLSPKMFCLELFLQVLLIKVQNLYRAHNTDLWHDASNGEGRGSIYSSIRAHDENGNEKSQYGQDRFKEHSYHFFLIIRSVRSR